MEVCGCSAETARQALSIAGPGGIELTIELALGGGLEPARPPQDQQYKCVCLVRTDLGMGVGKIAAQVSHATLGAYRDACTSNSDAVRAWSECGEPTIVLQVPSLAELDARKAVVSAGPEPAG